MAAHRARWYGEKLRTSASFVSPVNSHRCVLRLPFPPLFPLPLSLLFSKRAPRHRPPSRASPVRTRVHRVYIKPSPLSRPSRFAIMPRDRPASDRASCFATNDWTTQKTVAKSPISTFIELRCSTDSPPPPPPPTFLPSSPRFLFLSPLSSSPSSFLECRSRSNAAYDASSTWFFRFGQRGSLADRNRSKKIDESQVRKTVLSSSSLSLFEKAEKLTWSMRSLNETLIIETSFVPPPLRFYDFTFHGMCAHTFTCMHVLPPRNN